MPIVGVETLTFGVADLETSVRFHEDFGLVLDERTPGHARFRLAEGSTVEFRPSEDPVMPPAFLDGPGPREIVWGVASAEALAALAEDLGRDREVAVDPDGTLHLTDDGGMRIGFRRFERVPLALETAPGENNLSQTTRWNRHRKWYESARPKVINHVVFGLPEVERRVDFYVERLGFRVTDIIRGFGVFLRCDGRHDHHNLLLFRAGKRLFSHVSFGVETIDELMTGANLMQRRGWS
ncbi:MAG TPA: VOC family protein, partial [Stellaceae bacterium]|nr:VOC family protein [Stellaceae bacterium]